MPIFLSLHIPSFNLQLVEIERERAENERQRADKLAEYLRSLGVDPDSIN
jgi:hypothetical protein